MPKKIVVMLSLMIVGIVGSFVHIDKSMDRCQDSLQQLKTEVQDQIDVLRIDRVPQLILHRMPSVVIVHAISSKINPNTGEPAMMTASGVVMSRDGKILTASHVVDDLFSMDIARLWVVFADGAERDVVQIAYAGGRNPDVGLIWIDPEGLNLHPVEVSDWKMEAIQGEQVIVIGAPHNLSFSVTCGIVSSADRVTMGPHLEDQLFIQVDAPINGGNSGGPVFDMGGKLIGIVSWKMSGDGLAFIVPVQRILIGLKQCEGKETLVQLEMVE